MLIGYPNFGQILANLFTRVSDSDCKISVRVLRYKWVEESINWSSFDYGKVILNHYLENPALVKADMIDWPLFQDPRAHNLIVDLIFEHKLYHRLNQFLHSHYVPHVIKTTDLDISRLVTPQQRRAFVTSERFGKMPKEGIPHVTHNTLCISSYCPFKAVQYLCIGIVTGKNLKINSFTIRLTAPVCPGAEFVFAHQPQGSNEIIMKVGRVVNLRLFKLEDEEIQPYGEFCSAGIEGTSYCIELEAKAQMPYKETKIFTVHRV